MKEVEVEAAIIDAVIEAKIMESARDEYEHQHMIVVAAKLSKCDLSVVEKFVNK